MKKIIFSILMIGVIFSATGCIKTVTSDINSDAFNTVSYEKISVNPNNENFHLINSGREVKDGYIIITYKYKIDK